MAEYLKSGDMIKKVLYPLLTVLLTVSMIFSVSCFAMPGGSAVESGSVTDQQEEENKPDITEQTSADDSMPLEEDQETFESVDYSTVSVAAEITGYIPSFLSTVVDNYVTITIKNNSDFLWKKEKPGSVRIGYHYYGQDVDFSDYDQTVRTALPENVEPGSTITVNVLINDIKNPGYYIIQIDPVLEGNEIPENNFWFSNKDVKMLEGLAYFGTGE